MRKLKNIALILFVVFCFLNIHGQQWIGITKLIDNPPANISIDSSTNSLLLSNGPKYVNNVKYYYCLIWNGSAFDSLASYSNGYLINQILKFNNDYYACTFNKVLKKSGNYTWLEIGKISYGSIEGISTYNNNLIVFGGFDTISNIPASNIAKYDGNNWNSMDTLHFINGVSIKTVQELNGNLYIGGNMVAKNGSCDNLCMFNGVKFVNVDNNAMGGSNSAVTRIIKYKNAIYMIGNFHKTKGNPGNSIVKWDGIQWDSLKGGITAGNPTIWDVTEFRNELYFVGWFSEVAGMTTYGMFKFDGSVIWGGNVCYSSPLVDIRDVVAYNDTLYVSGGFSKLCSDSARYLAKWLGNSGSFTNSVTVVGINENFKNKNDVEVFPNPVSSVLNIEFKNIISDALQIEITNGIGQIVLSTKFEKEINVSNLQAGLYLLKIKSQSGEVITKRFVVAR